MYDELADEAWYVRRSVPLMRRFRRASPRQRAASVCGALGALLLLYAALNAALGLDRVSEIDERKSSLYGTLERHTDAFAWDGDVRDSRVAAHVLEARARIVGARHLTLVGAQRRAEPRSRTVSCSELFSVTDNSTEVLNALFYRVGQHLRDNRALQRCACAPQFGERRRYMAFLTKHDVDLAQQLQERNGGAETLDVDADGTTVVHMINPRDELAALYDALDDSGAERALPDLSVVDERQAARYNDEYRGNGTFAVLRRDRVRIDMMDRQCHTQSVHLKGELAHCAQRCLDLLDGVSVAQRAERQLAAGVRLNAAVIEAHAAQAAQAEKDEL